MSSFHAETTLTSATSREVDVSGICLWSVALVFTGTATAKIEANVGGAAWTEIIASTSSDSLFTYDYAVRKLRITCSAYTSGNVSLYFNGVGRSGT
jgi:hypothetical protein